MEWEFSVSSATPNDEWGSDVGDFEEDDEIAVDDELEGWEDEEDEDEDAEAEEDPYEEEWGDYEG